LVRAGLTFPLELPEERGQVFGANRTLAELAMKSGDGLRPTENAGDQVIRRRE